MTAYKDFAMLVRSLRRLRMFDVDVYLHVDRKTRFANSEMEILKGLCRTVQTCYDIPWGGHEHIQAIVGLMRDAVLSGEPYGYVHTLSGQDIVIKPLSSFTEYWDGTIYMKSIPRHDFPENVEARIAHRNLLHSWQKRRRVWQTADLLLQKIQALPGLARSQLLSQTPLHKGEVWLSMPFAICRRIVESSEAHALLHELRTTYIPEEFFFQSVIMNWEYASRVNQRNLRYTDWHSGRGRPAFLDDSDFGPILNSGDVFARKVSTEKSDSVVTRLEAEYGKS
ncbi:beta-1,6-N-acetylglucosaminyltransferase [Sphingomonas faeni]|uniref:beta-1,6-N-acetylglucosaminyltransferase n=1 Tax=Sphingomonas faeni TaxID=185950 RepID=UPI0027D8AD15|nr:beta-1,6-N-acetylglucosaminyltransferase [Sphingomonas faeni]